MDEDHIGHRPLLANSASATKNTRPRDLHDSPSRPERDDDPGRDDAAIDQDALHGANVEHRLTVREAIKAYPMAIFWSLAVSMCVIMEGFDSILVSNFYAFPTFQRKCMLLPGFGCHLAPLLTRPG